MSISLGLVNVSVKQNESSEKESSTKDEDSGEDVPSIAQNSQKKPTSDKRRWTFNK